jgi:hypothetical protein
VSARVQEQSTENSHAPRRSPLRTYTEYAAARVLLGIIGVWPRSIAARRAVLPQALLRGLFFRIFDGMRDQSQAGLSGAR